MVTEWRTISRMRRKVSVHDIVWSWMWTPSRSVEFRRDRVRRFCRRSVEPLRRSHFDRSTRLSPSSQSDRCLGRGYLVIVIPR